MRNRHPENYPSDWKAVAAFIRQANEYVCQECGRHCQKPGEPYRGGRNVLTVAHVDNDYHSAEIFVAALCSGCHLRHDAALRQRVTKAAQERIKPRFHGFFEVRE